MTVPGKSADTRDRLMESAARLLREAAGKPVSTRAICDLAGVREPTLYHYFGSKQGLIDAVITYGFTQYIRARSAEPGSGGPVADLRRGWDHHVRYGLEHPAFYALMYGRIEPGRPSGVTAVAESMLLGRLSAAAREGMLRISPEEAMPQIMSANVGVTLYLIARPPGEADLALSDRLRDATLDAVIRPGGKPVGAPGAVAADAMAQAAITLGALLDARSPAVLSPHETALLRDWLRLLASARTAPSRAAAP
jgi:AcrR family transcriptional regulator